MPTLRLLPDLEDALRQIPGIRAVSVVTDPKAVPTEVHVLASPGKPAKQLVRDVQSVALTRYDIDLDHRIVSVVQIGEEEDSTPPNGARLGRRSEESTRCDRALAERGHPDPDAEPAATPHDAIAIAADSDDAIRPSITSLTVRTSGAEAEAVVRLAFGDETFDGTASGSGAASYRHRLVAQATLSALEPLLGLPTEVESVTVIEARHPQRGPDRARGERAPDRPTVEQWQRRRPRRRGRRGGALGARCAEPPDRRLTVVARRCEKLGAHLTRTSRDWAARWTNGGTRSTPTRRPDEQELAQAQGPQEEEGQPRQPAGRLSRRSLEAGRERPTVSRRGTPLGSSRCAPPGSARSPRAATTPVPSHRQLRATSCLTSCSMPKCRRHGAHSSRCCRMTVRSSESSVSSSRYR